MLPSFPHEVPEVPTSTRQRPGRVSSAVMRGQSYNQRTMPPNIQQELNDAVDAILNSTHPKRIIVAGAGAGKTTVFKKVLEKLPASAPENRLVMTFIGGLKRDLEKELSDHARTYTFHGYCLGLLKQNPGVRVAVGLTEAVAYVPRLGNIVKRDWTIINESDAPKFVPKLRNLIAGPEVEFFLARGRYYDAVGYDDSVGHIQSAFAESPADIPRYDVVIVDEFQDFNRAEVQIIDQLSSVSNVVIAGDDDQALYGRLRDASEDFIREFYARTDYVAFNLPFCMRCSSAIVEATTDIIANAHSKGLLGARIDKRFEPFPPAKVAVDAACPKIKVVKTSVQTPRSNYFGKYILEQIATITPAEITESHEKGFPTVLIIGGKPYAEQVKTFLEENAIIVETKPQAEIAMDEPFTRDDGLTELKNRDNSNLGWRILLGIDQPAGYNEWIKETSNGTPLAELLSGEYRTGVEAEVASWEPEEVDEIEAVSPASDKPTIRLTTFEGSKGMSAQRVFILGLQEGGLPYNAANIKPIEVRRMIVALTRTRRQCYLLLPTTLFGRNGRTTKRQSIFVDWIRASRKEVINVNAAYWTDR